MDFLLLLPHGARVVIEVDGRQHYGERDQENPERFIASAYLYSKMAKEDRALRLAGYEVYRFVGHELTEDEAAAKVMLRAFFVGLLGKHAIGGRGN